MKKHDLGSTLGKVTVGITSLTGLYVDIHNVVHRGLAYTGSVHFTKLEGSDYYSPAAHNNGVAAYSLRAYYLRRCDGPVKDASDSAVKAINEILIREATAWAAANEDLVLEGSYLVAKEDLERAERKAAVEEAAFVAAKKEVSKALAALADPRYAKYRSQRTSR